MECSEEPLSKY
uniref:Uncharacterized protein n=1 Tax=Anguilla anguilla TaxID=7936 RepID=A0A0E9UT19_ANGAN